MTTLAELLTPDRIVLGLRARDKAQLLAALAKLAASSVAVPEAAVLSALSEREQLGSTGLGHGFALPHVRLASIAAPVGSLVRLARPIAFDAIDGQPVDVVFMLLMPVDAAQEHVAALAAVSRSMRMAETLPFIRKAPGAAAIWERLVG